MLIAILACFDENSPSKMKKALLLERKHLLSNPKKKVIVYYDKKLYFSSKKRMKLDEIVSDELFELNRWDYYCRVLGCISLFVPPKEKVDVLFSSHNNAKFLLSNGEIVYSPHDGKIEIRMDCLFSKIKMRNLILNCCNGNQVDLEGVDFEKCLICLDSIDYEGVIGEKFWDEYPSLKKLALSSKARVDGRWCVINRI